jgi:hypothetical protein
MAAFDSALVVGLHALKTTVHPPFEILVGLEVP